MPHRGAPAGCGDGSIPAFPGVATVGDQALGNASDAHFFAWRGGGGEGEEVAGEAVGLGATLLGDALDRRAPCGREHRGQREHCQQHQRGMDRGQQRHGDAESQDPAAGGKQRHVHVVQHEHLVAQHGEAIEVVRAFLVGNGGHRGLQARDVGFEGNGHPVAEAALHAGADGAQEPRRGR